MVELLAPAGSLEALKAAVNAGADAVYIGGSKFGARAYADNPAEDQLLEGLDYCHLHGKKLYMTVNTLLKENELQKELFQYLLPYYCRGLDGVIVQDIGVVSYIQKHFPGLEVHASTQMTITSTYAAQFLKNKGLTRVVPARELSLDEIRNIIDETGIEVETFVHGAMCYCYSGQCLLSSMIGGRSGNRGRCAQPCRLPYKIDKKESYLLSMKDMCTIDLIPQLIDAKIASFKIEGRMKRPEYTAGVVSIYRKYIDLYLEKGRGSYKVSQEDRNLLMDLYNRGGFTDGYYRQHNGPAMMAMERANHRGTLAATVIEVKGNQVKLKANEPLFRQDVLEFSKEIELTITEDVKKGAVFAMRLPNTFNKNGKTTQKPANGATSKSKKTIQVTSVHAGDVIYRTKSNYWLSKLYDQYCKENQQVKIKGNLRISAYRPAILEVCYGNIRVTRTKEIAQIAQTNATTADVVERQMRKTGQTSFCFEELTVDIDDQLFIPVKLLNELRREALEELSESIYASYQRTDPRQLEESALNDFDIGRTAPMSDTSDNAEKDKAESNKTRINIAVSVMNVEQLETILHYGSDHIQAVYIDSLIWREPSVLEIIDQLQKLSVHVYLSLPPVLREKELAFMRTSAVRELLAKADGYLVHTLDELAYIKGQISAGYLNGVIIADHTLYSYNKEAASYYWKEGIAKRTLPIELHYKEMKPLTNMPYESELVVYGHQALMHSAQCIVNNTKGCTGKPVITQIQDRKHTYFPVVNRCNVCCNTIFNSVPIHLASCIDDIKSMNISGVRLEFTVESKDEMQKILELYQELFYNYSDFTKTYVKNNKTLNDMTEGTRGHFRRGVE